MDVTNLWAMDRNAQAVYYNATGTSHPNAPDVSYPAFNNETGASGSTKRSLEGPFVTPSEKRVKPNPSSSSTPSLNENFATASINDAPNPSYEPFDWFTSSPDDDESSDEEGPFSDFSDYSPSLDNFEAFNHVYFYADAAGLFDNDGEEFRNPFLDDRDIPNRSRPEGGAPSSPLFGTNSNSNSDIVSNETNPFHPDYVELKTDSTGRVWDGPFCKNEPGVEGAENQRFVDRPFTGKGICMEGEGESRLFCPVPRRDSRWNFVMDDSEDEEYDSEDEEDDEIVPPVSHPALSGQNNWSFMMDDSDDEEGLFSASDYEMEAEPASLPRSTNEETWSSEGNPFGEAIEHSQLSAVFADMDVEGLINDCGMELEDNDHLRFPPGVPSSLWIFEPHPPFDGCGCHWCESYRVGGNWEPHNPTIWCSCVLCVRFRVYQHEAELREKQEEDERRSHEQMLRMDAESKEAVKEETRFIDLMDFVPDEDEQRQSRADLFRTIKDRLRTRNPRP